jgi:formate dehydrogenase subunit gamma
MTGETFSIPAFTIAEYDFYRLDDRIFWAFIVAGLAYCVVHAARRAFRQPVPTDLGQDEGTPSVSQGEEILRHALFQRIYHWSNSVAVLTLTISGWLIYQPRGIPTLEGTPFDRFFWHRWGAALLLVGVVAHLIYESFIAREPNPMVWNGSEVRKVLAIFKNFFGFSKIYPKAGKYHSGQIFFHWAVAGNILALVVTGFVLWKPLRDFLPLSLFGLGWDFVFYCRLFHGFFSATLIASLIGHIYFALFIKKNWVETKSMITGRVALHEYLDSHSLSE